MPKKEVQQSIDTIGKTFTRSGALALKHEGGAIHHLIDSANKFHSRQAIERILAEPNAEQLLRELQAKSPYDHTQLPNYGETEITHTLAAILQYLED